MCVSTCAVKTGLVVRRMYALLKARVCIGRDSSCSAVVQVTVKTAFVIYYPTQTVVDLWCSATILCSMRLTVKVISPLR